jgi:hypothetical protein
MRAKSKLVSFVLCAVLMFGFALTASAQVNYQLSSTPTNVIQTGLTEILGEVRLTQNNPPTNAAQTTIAGSITVLYQGVPITNTFSGQKFLTAGTGIFADAGGITVTGTGGFNNAGVGILVESNSGGAGGLVTITIPGALTINPGDWISINGVRATVTGVPLNNDVFASVQANPPTSNLFANSVVRVARTFPGLVVGISAATSPICISPPSTPPTLALTEGFPGAFVQYVTVAGVAPANPRPKYGANSNTQIHIVVGALPTAGVTLTWPDTVTATSGVGTLVLLSSTNTDAVYQFTTTDQGASDAGFEIFNVSPTVELEATAEFGQSTIQAQLYPAQTPSTGVPRYNDPLQPATGGNFLNVSKCVTNILFPWVANTVGYDTGVAIANTSKDPFISPATLAQSGTITFYGYAQGHSADPPITFTTPVVAAGDTFAATASGSLTGFAGFQGYVIAVCQFQFAHGYVFITANLGSSAPAIAEGYLGIIIPDPSVTGTARTASPPSHSQSGENLSN